MFRRYKPAVIIIVFLFSFSQFVFPQTANTVYQYSVITSLMQGNFDGDLKISELKKHGNFGLGTFNRLDGEMIIVDGHIYQMKADGRINPAADNSLIPFGVITDFKGVKELTNTQPLSLSALCSLIDKTIESSNYIYAVRVNGTFSYVKTRSLPPQDKPYKTLAEATQNQAVFEYKNVKGTLVGFRFPNYADGINVPGYHFHFISDDKKSGGHVLDLLTEGFDVELQKEDNIQIAFPGNKDFQKADLSKKNPDELNKAEK